MNNMYTKNFSQGRRLTYADFAVMWPFCESFHREIWGSILGTVKASNLQEFSLRKSSIRESFQPSLVFTIQWLTGSAEKIGA